MPVMQSSTPTRVYIVDDSDSIRARIVALLESIDGIAIVGQATCVDCAIAGIRDTRPDSVLLDLNLKGASGMQVLSTIHREMPVVEFVVLTNHAEPQYRRACAKAGARYFLDKSIEFDSVRRVIAEIAANRHQGSLQ
jgi:DNA-binding NarL/FixJ family response regulator